MPFIYTYLIDGNGDYILDGSSNRIIVDSFEYQVTSFDWRRIASSVKKPPYIRSFQIRKFDGGATWLLIVNQKQLIGIYPSQDAALQVLTGLFTRVGASEEFAQSTMSYQLSLGSSTIDDAFNNITLEQSGDDLIITLSNINTTGLATATVEYDDYTTPGTPGALTLVGAVTEPEAGTQIFTVVNGYAGVPENSYIQAFFTDFGVSTESSSNVLIKDDVAPTGFSVKIGTISDEDAAPEATTDGVTYTGAAYAYPQWVSNDWPEGVTPSYSYAWTYTIDAQAPVPVGGTGSTLNLALVPYGATLTCGAVATAYVNGQIATSTDPATQVAVAVTQTNIEEVADIKLFLTADPNGVEQTTIQPTTEYFAYAYDTNGTLLTDTDITWEFPGKLIAPSNVAFNLTGNEAVGKTLTVDTVTHDGDVSTITYSWNGTGTPNDQSTYLLDAGDEGNTVTVTVTATNNGGTSDGTATTGAIGPYVAPNDWDTSSISVTNEFINAGGTWVSVGALTPSGTNFAPGQYREGFTGLAVRQGNAGNDYSTLVPYLAIWNVTQLRWTVHAWISGSGNNEQVYNKASYEPAASGLPGVGETIRVVGLTQYTVGDVSNWTAYA